MEVVDRQHDLLLAGQLAEKREERCSHEPRFRGTIGRDAQQGDVEGVTLWLGKRGGMSGRDRRE